MQPLQLGWQHTCHLWKANLPVLSLGLPCVFIVRFFFCVTHRYFTLHYIIPSRNCMQTVCSNCSLVQLSHHLWAVSKWPVDHRFNVVL